MNFNLKNRPKPMCPERYSMECDQWFEGFEKELREMLDQDKELVDLYSQVAKGHWCAIKEILGEDE